MEYSPIPEARLPFVPILLMETLYNVDNFSLRPLNDLEIDKDIFFIMISKKLSTCLKGGCEIDSVTNSNCAWDILTNTTKVDSPS